ncbi:response regulator transcription factor [Streptomyces atrovirens]|uniref:Response regulator transcription factor n=1 Tax=Streptomyces atrovirens TaxID=285556 RepID=A0ABW0E3Q3_9ACTN
MTRAMTLSQSDREIVRLLYQGLGDAAIGRRLGLGHRTVQRRVQQLMRRWEVPGRVALGARAQELGLFDDPVSGERRLGAGPPIAA